MDSLKDININWHTSKLPYYPECPKAPKLSESKQLILENSVGCVPNQNHRKK